MIFDKVILGKGVETTMNCRETGINNNQLVVGTSGSGKTLSLVVPRMLETRNSSLIVTLAKRDLVNMLNAYYQGLGVKTYDLNFTDPLHSDVGYDPLRLVKSPGDVDFLARAIVMADPRTQDARDPYWYQAAVSLLASEINALLEYRLPRRPTFADVLELHEKLRFWAKEDGKRIVTSFDDLFAKLDRRMKGQSNAVRCWQSFCNLPINTAGCVHSFLNTSLDTIFTAENRQLMARKEQVDFERIAGERSVLFVTTSPVNKSYNAFINLFYSQAFKKLYEYAETLPTGALPLPTHVICDDFAANGKIEGFPELISVMRAKNMSATLLLQSDSQLIGMYGLSDATTIRNNCDTYIYLGGNDLNTARDISCRTNLPLEDILYMELGKEIIFRRGQKPVFADRYDILHNEDYQNICNTHANGQEREV